MQETRTPQRHDAKARALSSADLLSLDSSTPEWLVERRLTIAGTSVLTGRPGTGKRALARDLSLAAARGAPWLGAPVSRGPVLYVHLKGELPALRELFKRGGLSPDDEVYFLDSLRPIDRLLRIREYAKSLQPALVIIDGIDELRMGEDLNSELGGVSTLDRVIRLARDTQTHVLMIHDTADRLRTDLGAFVSSADGALDAILMLNRSGGQRRLRTVQRRGSNLLHGIAIPDDDPGESGDLESRVLAYLRRSARLADQDEIERQLGEASHETRAAIRELHRRGQLIRFGRGTAADPHRFTGFDRVGDPGHPEWLRRVRPWARIGRTRPAKRLRDATSH